MDIGKEATMMKRIILGLAGMVGVVWMAARVLAVPPQEKLPVLIQGHASKPLEGSSSLIAFATTVADKYQQITLIDPKTQVMSVYHIDLADGKIRLRSVRNFHWDFQLIHLNGQPPLPQEIQTLLEQSSP